MRASPRFAVVAVAVVAAGLLAESAAAQVRTVQVPAREGRWVYVAGDELFPTTLDMTLTWATPGDIAVKYVYCKWPALTDWALIYAMFSNLGILEYKATFPGSTQCAVMIAASTQSLRATFATMKTLHAAASWFPSSSSEDAGEQEIAAPPVEALVEQPPAIERQPGMPRGK